MMAAATLLGVLECSARCHSASSGGVISGSNRWALVRMSHCFRPSRSTESETVRSPRFSPRNRGVLMTVRVAARCG